MFRTDGSLMGSHQPVLHKRDYKMSMWQQIRSLLLAFCYFSYFVMVAFFSQRRVSLPSISNNYTAMFDIILYKWYQAFCRSITNLTKSDSTKLANFYLYCNNDQCLLNDLPSFGFFFLTPPM